MAGSLRQRADRGADAWELRVYLGRDAAGKIRHRSVLFRGTKRSAQRELARLVAEQDRAPALVPDDAARAWGPATTINDAIEAWQAATRSAGAGSPASAPTTWSTTSGT
jgi:hypothetical protein